MVRTAAAWNVQACAEVHFFCMAEPHIEPQVEQKPGTGVDRTVIRNLLALTPAERARIAVESARNVMALLAKARRL
jgi:hypothetical protein